LTEARHVRLVGHDRHFVKDERVGPSLTWQSSQGVASALDLEADKIRVDDRKVNPRGAATDGHLIDDARGRV
jgi:hypothetical protein